jgi:tetratricopeptide (TPR) repeat protein
MNDDNISFLGVKKSFLTIFLSQYSSLNELSGKTTADVCEIIKDLTKSDACSLCELLSKGKNNNYLNVVAKANLFVSHAWQSPFLQVVDALLEYESHDNIEPVFWFDVFSVNQHKQSSPDFHWWSTTFREAIKEIGHTIMVITPWYKPETLTRAWCIWELFCTIDTETKFELLINQSQMKDLDGKLGMNEFGCSGSIKLFQSNVNSKSSRAKNPEDQKNIHAAIEQTIGFSSLDRLVFHTMEKYMILTLQKKLENCNSEASLEASHLHDLLAMFYQEKGQIDLAEEHFSKSLELKSVTLSPNDVRLWLAKANLASIMINRGRYAEAETKLQECLEAMEGLVRGKWLKQTVMNNLAMVYKLNGNLLQAEQLFTKLLQLQDRLTNSGQFYTDSFYTTMGNLAQVYREQGKLTESMQLTDDLIERRKKTHGENHPDNIYEKSNLALLYQRLHQYDRAETIFLSCFNDLQCFSGSTHPDTILMAKNLAMNYACQGRLDLAESRLRQCLKQEKELFDDQYLGVYLTIDHLAKVLIEQDKYEDAETLLRNSMSQLLARMGQDYPGLVDLKMVLSKVYRAQGKYSLALSYMEQCYEARKSAFGTNNQETLECLQKIAATQAEMGMFDLSEVNFKKCIKKRTELHGEKNSNTLNTMKELADLYLNQQMLELAETLFSKYVRLSKELYGFENDQIFDVMFTLIEIYTKLERFQKAETTLKQIIKATNRMEEGSEKQKRLAGFEASLAAIYLKQDKPELAEPIYARLLEESGCDRTSSYFVLYQSLLICYLEQELYERARCSVIEFIKVLTVKEGTLEYAENMNFVGRVYYKLCEDIFAESIFRQGLSTVRKLLHEASGDSQYAKSRAVEVSIVTNLVQLYTAQGRYDLAVLTESTLIENFELIGRIPNEAVQIFKKRYEQLKVLKGNFHPGTIGSMVNLGRVLSLDEGNHVQAECLFSESINCGKLIFGEDHFRCYLSKMHLGKLYLDQGKDEEALALIYDCAIRDLREKQQQGAENEAFDISVMWLVEVFSRQSKYDLAEKVTTCCLQVIKQILGVSHPLTLKLTFRLFELLDVQGKYDLAGPLFHEALRISRQLKEEAKGSDEQVSK